MTTRARQFLAAIMLGLAFGLPAIASATTRSGELSVDNNVVGAESSVPDSFNEIVSLRLRINSRNEVQLIKKRVVSGNWVNSRLIPVGTRFYYEVVDYNGRVVAKGFRKDPRGMHEGDKVDFLLTAPYNTDCAYVNLYVVDYENGGKGGYSRDYSLLGSFDVRQKQTVQVD